VRGEALLPMIGPSARSLSAGCEAGLQESFMRVYSALQPLSLPEGQPEQLPPAGSRLRVTCPLHTAPAQQEMPVYASR
jgi:hypothetical protein